MNDLTKTIYSALEVLKNLAKRPDDKQALENALMRVSTNKGRVMAAFHYDKIHTKGEAQQGCDFVDLPKIPRDFHLVLIERVGESKMGLYFVGKDFMRGNGTTPYSMRMFYVSRIATFDVTGTMPMTIKTRSMVA